MAEHAEGAAADSCGRLDLERIPVKFADRKGHEFDWSAMIQMQESYHKMRGSVFGWRQGTACGESTDALWHERGLMLLDHDAAARLVLDYHDALVCDVQWDGRSLWIATRDKGLWVMGPGGDVSGRLRSLGVEAIVPAERKPDWLSELLKTGEFDGKKVAYLLEGEGVSAFAAEVSGLINCRARVELRLIPVPGQSVVTTEKGVAAKVDLMEALAAKAALESAGLQAVDALLLRFAADAAQRPGKTK